ncbi:SDR family oxidoreductase [Pelagibacteraceae bacterium]|jgi:3-oxoacyl-[acyl-carrier protein] reductase|nr:SDR family oxidoreductase [Pelagibacteraceae bacterium]
MKKNNLLVVGATSGIMISCLETFLTKNYNITATYHDDKSLLNISDKVKNSSNIRFLKLDLNSNNSEIIESLKKNNVKADMIINAVGGSFGIKEYPFDMTSWQKMLDINVLKHIMINNYFLDQMKKNNFGRILFFSTTAVEDKNASIAYSTSKAFLENYVVKSANIFGKHNILINCIKTSIIAAKNNNWYKASVQKPDFVKDFAKKYISVERLGKGDDLSDFISLIISEKNEFMNGSIVRIDGGLK